LPDDRALERLLREAGFEVRWDGSRILPLMPATSTSLRSSTSTGGLLSQLPGGVVDGPDARLRYAMGHGGARMLTFRSKHWADCRAHLAELVGHDPIDASAAFVGALREVARELRITDFGVLLRADAPDADPRARSNFQRVVDRAWTRLAEQWTQAEVLVLDGLTPFGRYTGGMAVLDTLLENARQAGRYRGPRTVLLLCPSQDELEPPSIGEQAISRATAEEWIVGTSAWLSRPTVA
jgi:hypothetical protein